MTVTAKKLGQQANPENPNWLESAFQPHWTGGHLLLQCLLQGPDAAQDLAVETFWRLHQHPPGEYDPARLGGREPLV